MRRFISRFFLFLVPVMGLLAPMACDKSVAVPVSSLAVANYAYQGQFGGPGTGNGQFQSPMGVAQDSSGNLYVTDKGNNRVEKFDAAGNYLGQWGSSGTGNGQLAGPTGIAWDPVSENLFVSDTGNNRVQVFTTNGAYVAQWGMAGTGNGEFSGPQGLALDQSSNVYVVDRGNHRVQKFSIGGTYEAQWGGEGSGNGKFDYPAWAVYDPKGFLYITDTYNYLVQKFKTDGTFQSQWGGEGGPTCYCFCLTGGPGGLTIDLFGHIFVCDGGNGRVEEFTNDGQGVTTFGDSGPVTSISRLADNQDLVINLSGEIVVVDTNNNRIAFYRIQP